ncbi:MAG: DNA primase [Planctomycetes bacterium]|nr:DNA primase [Planctomycetota bacterium]MBU1517816.1 DNA primase [Planctomycetota bacterium]MBU2457392.1 DNA primase [Planctomycetota bacterium]MBU2597396.1 DNA primase [Planctomycetota bacterium]
MKLDHSQISRIQQANDIVDVISEHVKLTRKGKEMVGLCPFHDDHKPSMNVNPDKQIFKCFSCSTGGDVIKFIQMREGLSFMRAVERLAERAGIKLTPSKRPAGQQPEGDPADIEKVNKWAMKFWRKNLLDGSTGQRCREYINSRQITEKTSEEFALGFASEKWDDFLNAAKKKIPEKLMLAAGLIVSNEQGNYYDKFRNRLMFPIIDASSRIIGFGGRTLGDDPAKYMNSPATIIFDKSNCVYGLDKGRHEIVSSGTVAVVEGYTDVIMAHQAGCRNVVATLGTSFTVGHARLLRRYAKNIVLVFDSDTAGAAAAERALEICLAERIDIKLASVPQGKDPCDFVLAKGGQAFKELIETATDVMQYRWERLTEKFSGSDNLADRRAATEEFLRTVAAASKGGTLDTITYGLIINRLSRILQIPAEDIRRELARRGGPSRQAVISTIENAKVSSVELGSGLGAKAQAEIIEVLLNEPRLFASAAKKIKSADFDVQALREIWLLIENASAGEAEYSLTDLLAQTESKDVSGLIVKLSDNGQNVETLRKRLNGAMEAMDEYRSKKGQTGKKTDDDEMLKRISDIKAKPDRRNPGLMPI